MRRSAEQVARRATRSGREAPTRPGSSATPPSPSPGAASPRSTSATRPCASGASTCPDGRPRRRRRSRRTLLHRAARGQRRGAGARSSSTGGRRSPSPSTGRPPSSRWASSAAATSSPDPRAGVLRRDRRRGLRRGRDRSRGAHGGGGGRAARGARPGPHRPDGRHRRHDPGRAGRGHPGRRSPACSSCRAVPAPARPRSRCTAPRTSSTPTASRLGGQGVLLVGPSPIFLRYIDQVLPSLGEDEVQLATPRRSSPSVTVRANDPPASRRSRATAAWPGVDRGALRDREQPLPATSWSSLDGDVLRLHAARLARIVERHTRAPRARTTSSARTSSVGGRALQRRVPTRCSRPQYRDRLDVDDVTVAAQLAPGEQPPEDWDHELAAGSGGPRRSRAALERMWPVLSGAELVHDLFSFEALVRSAADGILTADEQRRLVRPRVADVRECVDRGRPRAHRRSRRAPRLAGARPGPPAPPRLAARVVRRRPRPHGRRARRRRLHDRPQQISSATAATAPTPSPTTTARPRTFGHVLVDEAQDLSPMQWRMLARRCPSGSMTLVGDFGQASRAGCAVGLGRRARHVPDARPRARTSTLTVNYRTPAEIMEVAEPACCPPRHPASSRRASVRSTGVDPEVEAVAPASSSPPPPPRAARRRRSSGAPWR